MNKVRKLNFRGNGNCYVYGHCRLQISWTTSSVIKNKLLKILTFFFSFVDKYHTSTVSIYRCSASVLCDVTSLM